MCYFVSEWMFNELKEDGERCK